MNAKDRIWVSGEENSNEANSNDGIYALVTKLSSHLLRTHGSFYQTNVRSTLQDDVKLVRHLRAKAYEILLKKNMEVLCDQDSQQFPEADPLVEIQKHVFVLKMGSQHLYNAATLEFLMEKIENLPCTDTSVLSVLQLLLQLKTCDVKSEPLMVKNIFYYDKTNPNIPQLGPVTNRIPPFQIYPMESFISSDKFDATLETQQFQITNFAITNIRNEVHFLNDSVKSRAMLQIESTDPSIVRGFMSNHAFDKVSSRALQRSSQCFTVNSEVNLCVLQNNSIEDTYENMHIFPLERGVVLDTLCLPLVQTSADEAESVIQERKLIDQSDVVESNSDTDIWNRAWSQNDSSIDTFLPDLHAWEYFGEIQLTKEAMFVTETSAAAVHLQKILQTTVTNNLSPLNEISGEKLINDIKSMLLGIESDSFEYRYTTGFAFRRNVSINGMSTESLEQTCQEAINWGNCLKFLSQLTAPKSPNAKLSQEGLIFKAMCSNIKELLLYYQAVLLRMFNRESKSDTLLGTFERVRSVATLITKVAKLCEPYKESRHTFREGSGILTRIYNEAIQVTDKKLSLVFYSLLKSCCDVYFRFLQKWIFEGICDDVYGEFMIKTRPQYLRNRSHKFWTKSFSICYDAVPGFLTDIAESILQCGKTVTLLRTCDTKNPVCHVCVTEQPEIKVCLSVASLDEQSFRCQEYERKGKDALGSALSLSAAILSRRQLKKEMSNVTVNIERDAIRVPRARGKRDDTVKAPTNAGRNAHSSSQEELRSTRNFDETERKNIPLSNRIPANIGLVYQTERANILERYQRLTSDIDKRRRRSQWRMNRMKLYEKRIDALNAGKLCLMGNRVETFRTITRGNECDTLARIEDENKNYAETSSPAAALDTMVLSRLEADPENGTQNLCGSNNNRNCDHSCVQVADATNARMLSAKGESVNEDTIDWREGRSLVIERPATLNVANVDEITKQFQYDMTPNNNQPDTTTKELIGGLVASATSLTTPMSCTSEGNFSSSATSPVSQTYTLGDASSADAATSQPPTVSRPSIPAIRQDSFSDLFEFARDEGSQTGVPVAATSLSVTDVETIDGISLQAYLEKSIRIPLRVQSQLVNNAVIKYFLKENNLLSHFHSLRSYFFLLNGEFAKSLTDSLYARLYEISIPVELFNSATLTNLLERALVNSFNSNYVNSELLSLSATDTPAELHISDPAALDCLSLNYKINWPLNVVLDETVVQQYGKVFKFLITSGRVSWVLQEDFGILKRERNAVASEQYHKLQLYRHAMTQFMNALHNYLTCSVLHASWAEFEKDLENSTTVDDIYFSHINYIKRILSRCMLNSRGEKVRACLNNIFKVILKFHNRIRTQNWITKSTTGHTIHPNFKKLEQMYRAFCELRAYMAHVAFKLATSGYQPHLMHFLNALNINQGYDLTVKTCRSSV